MYAHILFAVEFGKGTDVALDKIKQLIDLCCNPKVSLIHVVEPPYYSIYPNLSPEEQEAQCVELATDQLTAIGKKLNVPASNQHVMVGNPKDIIPSFIKERDVDLLIVGHHSRHGIYHLLGSTAYALLSNAQCHILTLPYPSYT